MKIAILYISAILAGFAISDTVEAQNCDVSRLAISEAGRYESRGATWAAIVVPSKLQRECLIELARSLHKSDPKTRFEFFDAGGKELSQYIYWSKNGMNDSDPYPDKWMSKHNLATLMVTGEGYAGECRWLLHFEHGEDVKFEAFPRPCVIK